MKTTTILKTAVVCAIFTVMMTVGYAAEPEMLPEVDYRIDGMYDNVAMSDYGYTHWGDYRPVSTEIYEEGRTWSLATVISCMACDENTIIIRNDNVSVIRIFGYGNTVYIPVRAHPEIMDGGVGTVLGRYDETGATGPYDIGPPPAP